MLSNIFGPVNAPTHIRIRKNGEPGASLIRHVSRETLNNAPGLTPTELRRQRRARRKRAMRLRLRRGRR